MNTEAAMGHAVAQIKAGSPADRVVAELVTMEVPEDTARQVVDRVLAMKRDAQARELAVSLLDQGKSEAEVWDALVTSGVEGAAAEALVKEIVQHRWHREQERQRAARNADVYEASLMQGGHDVGNFAAGFAFGFFCGCLALIISFGSSSMGSETKRGVQYGFATSFMVGVLIRVMLAASR